jgi:predicted RNase H-like nuclease (RuvC/YqgF family)
LEAEAEVEMTSEDLLNEFTSVIRGLMAEIKDMKDKQEKMEEQFSKFKAEPAAERVFDRKGYFEDKAIEKFSKLEAIGKLKTKK